MRKFGTFLPTDVLAGRRRVGSSRRIRENCNMSAESGGSTGSTEPCDVPNLIKPVQEAEHEVANSCSKLAVNDPSESLSRVYQSPHSASVTASILSGRSSTRLSVTASLPHVRKDEQEHQNEDATQYSRQSSKGSSQDTLEDQDARTTQPPPGENDSLTTPIEAEKIDSDEETQEMVITDYSTASLQGTYCLIQKKEEPDTIPNDVNETTPLFTMDDDDEPTLDQAGACANKADSDSPSDFTSRFSLTFAKEESIKCIPKVNPSACAAAESASESSANGKPNLIQKVEDESRAPESQPNAVPTAVEHIDKVDLHRESNNYRVANTGGKVIVVMIAQLLLLIIN